VQGDRLVGGMRVLDLGCGRASSSIFLRREFGVQVWATDLWFSVSETSRPFAAEFFDAIMCIDSFIYYGTDDLYLNYHKGARHPARLVACSHHNDGQTSTDPTIVTCCDADRLDLIRVNLITDPRYLSTATGKALPWRI
jgi:hypothetical protein